MKPDGSVQAQRTHTSADAHTPETGQFLSAEHHPSAMFVSGLITIETQIHRK